jgi:hypothetical protein
VNIHIVPGIGIIFLIVLALGLIVRGAMHLRAFSVANWIIGLWFIALGVLLLLGQ